jgi:hypothetical protein
MKSLSSSAPSGGLARKYIVDIAVVAGAILLAAAICSSIPHSYPPSRNREARFKCVQIIAALNAYYTEYGGFPPMSPPTNFHPAGGPADAIVGDPVTGLEMQNSTVFYTLRAISKGPNDRHAGNSRKIVFFQDTAARLSSAKRPFDGFFDAPFEGNPELGEGDGCLYDPWGHQYGIVMDTNGDERLDLTNIYTDFAAVDPEKGKAPRKRAGAFSMGKDGTLGNNGDRTYRRGSEVSDDIISWE